MTLTVGETLLQTRTTLERGGIGEAPLEAELLLGLAMNLDRVRLYASLAKGVPDTCQQTLERLVQRRLLREPLAYLRGMKEFFGLEFKVGPEVLIPRPETEILVEQAITLIEDRFPQGNAHIVDVGTGSGAVAVSLAVRLPRARLYATDISEAALATAQTNAGAHGVKERIAFLCGHLLDPLPGPVDMVVANLPYIKSGAVPSLEPEIGRFEPREALDGGPDGLDLGCRLLQQSPGHLRPEGTILLEMDPEQMDAASDAALAVYPGASIYRLNDLAGLERVLVIRCY